MLITEDSSGFNFRLREESQMNQTACTSINETRNLE